MKGAKPRPPPAGVRRRRSTPRPATAPPRPGCLDELRKASWSPSAPAEQKRRSYRAAARLSSKHDAAARPERIRGKTNQVRIGHSVTRTQILANKASSNLSLPRGARKHHHQIVGPLAPRHASNRDWRTIRRTNGEGIGDRQIAARRASKASRNRGLHAASANIITKSSACWACPLPQTGTRGPSVGQTVKELAIVQIAARRASKASRNRRCRAADQVLVNAPLQAPITQRSPSGIV